jgi:hypothetical protein
MPTNEPDRDDELNRTELLSAMRDEESPTPSTRRRFVTGVAGVAASLGFAGTASALDPTGTYALRERERAYQSPSDVRAAFESHAEDLFAELAAEGLLDSSPAELLAEESADVSALMVGGEPTAHIHAEVETDEGRLGINVEPDAGRRYAILHEEDGSGTVIDPEKDASTTGCYLVAGCMGGGCVCTDYEVCCDTTTQTCYTDGTLGTCSSCQYCLNDNCEDICGF